MKKAAIRYAEILEAGAWVTHQEQEEIAKLLRKLAMTEDEAWDELERKQTKNKIKQNMNERIKELAEQAGAAFHADTIIVNGKDADDFVKKFAELVRQDEREACAKLCEDINKTFGVGFIVVDHCAAAIRERTE
jgi:hypothetical protein